MKCKICGREIRQGGKYPHTCQRSCLRQWNSLLFVARRMKKNSSECWAEFVKMVEGEEGKSEKEKVEVKEKWADEDDVKRFAKRTNRNIEQAIRELKAQGVEVRWKDKSEEKPASIYEDGE